jgi:hypothetical protein
MWRSIDAALAFDMTREDAPLLYVLLSQGCSENSRQNPGVFGEVVLLRRKTKE